MKWSPQQDHALNRVSNWLQSGSEQVFRLFGYAGTGKTTLARYLAEDVSSVQFAAYTGKAAHVLHQKGCLGACTIHSLIYLPKSKSAELLRDLQKRLDAIPLDPETKLPKDVALLPRYESLVKRIREEHRKLKSPAFSLKEDSVLYRTQLLIVDECSMVDGKMGEDLLSFGCKVLVLGDPAQLPPVRGGGFFTEAKPDVMLTEIHRQAAGNPIIDLATKVRQGEALEPGQHGDSLVTDALTPQMALGADQIIVGRNRTRHAINARMRELRGFEGIVPNVGERLVCLRNNHDEGLLNGSVWNVQAVAGDSDPLCLSLSPEDSERQQQVLAHRGIFEGRELEFWEHREANEFDYGYALTCHKSQGSQWDRVLVMDESDAFRGNKRSWLYTAITRAAESVVVKL